MSEMKVAAVQMRAEVGNVAKNLAAAERLARDAFKKGARFVVLPEFFPSAVSFAQSMLSAWRPLDGEPLQLMQRLAREHDGVVGGSFIANVGGDCYNSFLLVFPDGTYFRHDKDVPTMWENCYYIGGNDDGVLDTPSGQIGVALCWELIRSQTPRRLRSKVDVVVGGSCWWDLRLPVDPKYEDDRNHLCRLIKDGPSQLARMVGAPVIHASHAGDFEGCTPGNEDKPYRSRFLGETQIVNGAGTVLARMTYDEGEGFVLSDLEFSRVPPSEAIPESFWIEPLPSIAARAWDLLGTMGSDYYRTTMKPMLLQTRRD